MRDPVLDPMIPEPFRVRRTWKETHDTFTFEIERANGGHECRFDAGQFNMLYVFGAGEVPISISGDPTKPQTVVHTVRAMGAVTEAMRELKRGDPVGVRGPYGTSWPVEKARGADVVIVAGGIGLAPLRPALYFLLGHREEYGRVSLLYGTRSPADILYRRELEQWRGRLDMEVEVTVDRADEEWRGNVGVVTTLLPRASFDGPNTIAMTCGPEVMMRFTVMDLLRGGVSPDNIYLSMERNMKCGIGQCGHCQLGPIFVCKDGPVFPYTDIRTLFKRREI